MLKARVNSIKVGKNGHIRRTYAKYEVFEGRDIESVEKEWETFIGKECTNV